MSRPALACAALGLVLLGAGGCDGSPDEAEIRKEIEKARICLNDSECLNLGAKCPFGCAVTVTRSEADRILGLLNGFESSCSTTSCAPVTRVVCEKGLCSAK